MSDQAQQQVGQETARTSSERSARVEQAVRECVDRCSQSDSRALCISEFMLALRNEHNWTMKDVLEAGSEALTRCRDSGARAE